MTTTISGYVTHHIHSDTQCGGQAGRRRNNGYNPPAFSTLFYEQAHMDDCFYECEKQNDGLKIFFFLGSCLKRTAAVSSHIGGKNDNLFSDAVYGPSMHHPPYVQL